MEVMIALQNHLIKVRKNVLAQDCLGD